MASALKYTTSAAPEMGRIPAAVATFGVSRSAIYRLAAENPTLLRKLARATMVDFAVLRNILSKLPVASVRGAQVEG